MTVLPLHLPSRQCHTCGKVGNLHRMLYIGKRWFCNAVCHGNFKGEDHETDPRPDWASDTLPPGSR